MRLANSTLIGDTKGRVDDWNSIKVLRMRSFMIKTFWPWPSSSDHHVANKDTLLSAEAGKTKKKKFVVA